MSTVTTGHPLTEDEVPETFRQAFDFASQHLEYSPSRGKRLMIIDRTCLQCSITEHVRVGIVRDCIRAGTLSGMCKSCALHVSHPKPKGNNSPAWKGGKRKTPRGYIAVHCPDHPYAQNGYVFEHRLIMEQTIGRYLLPTETVHHKNGIRDDNRPENLEVWAKNHSDGSRYEDLDMSQLEALITHLQELLAIKKAWLARNTSRTCPACGCIDKHNRPSQDAFLCVRCGFAGRADQIAAINISRRAVVNPPYVSTTSVLGT